MIEGGVGPIARVPVLEFRPDLQGLRAVAVVLVVAYHVGVPRLAGGFVGVDVFFVLSGYLITSLLWATRERAGTLALSEFYARRARRLLPASALVLVASAGACWWVYAPLEQAALAASARAVAAYVGNWWFASRAHDYFAVVPDVDPFLHAWSLAVEEQFYLVWPVLLAVVVHLAAPARARRVALVAIGGISLASFAVSVSQVTASPVWAFYGPLGRAWEFGVGALAALLSLGPRVAAGSAPRQVLVVGGLGLIAVAATSFSRTTSFPGAAALLPALGTVAVLVGGEGRGPAGDWGSRLLRSDALQPLGRWSYSWYLWHWPVLVLATEMGVGGSLALRAAWAAASLVVAVCAYRWVEAPLRGSRALARRPTLSLVLAGILSIGLVAGTWGWRRMASRWSETGPGAPFAAARTTAPALFDAGCGLGVGEVVAPSCLFGTVGADTTAVLFGDSHAAHWFPALDRIARSRNWRLLVLVKTGCPAADVVVWNEAQHRPFSECEAWRAAALERIERTRPALVVMASALRYVAVPDGSTLRVPVSPASWLEGSARTLTRLAAASPRVVLVRDTPYPGLDAPACLARAEWHRRDPATACRFNRDVATEAAVSEAERALVSRLPRVAWLDLTDAICPADECSVFQRGVVLFRDRNHLSVPFAEALTAAVERGLDATRAGARGKPSAATPAASVTGHSGL